MANCNDISDILKRDGTNQKGRFNEVLDPGNIELHDFDIEDWILFAYNFARHVNYFKTDNDKKPSGNWQELFNHFGFSDATIPGRTERAYHTLKKEITRTLNELEAKSALTPHMTLFVCFLKLLELSKKRFNGLTKRHLDFFYREILQIEKLPPTSDKVHIIFEIAKKSIEERIKAGTELDGGKDANGNKRIYRTRNELIANKATVAQLKSLYNDIELGEIKSSAISNSMDGKGKALPKKTNYWFPFGYTSTETNYTELEDARLGFAIASPLLQLQEGERNIDITVTFNETFSFSSNEFNRDDLIDNLGIFCSGEKEWLGPFELGENISFDSVEATQSSDMVGNNLRLVFQIPKDAPAIVGYDRETLGANFSSSFPIIRFLIRTENPKGHFLFRNLVGKTVKSITIKVNAQDVRSLTLHSDTGALNADKPFYPFTTQPVEGSAFTVDYPEMFAKKWTDATINIRWKNTPEDFVEHYEAYKKDYLTGLSKKKFLDGMLASPPEITEANQPEDFVEPPTANTESQPELNTDINNLIVQSNAHFKAVLTVLNREEWDLQNSVQVRLFSPLENEGFETNTTVSGIDYDIDKSGPVRLVLDTSFLHTLFPRIYTLALISEASNSLIPNEPYTPFADAIRLNYTAEEHTDFTSSEESDYNANRIKLFHEAAFGQYEDHPYLKKNAIKDAILHKNTSTTTWLVPDYCNGGELYIGLDNAEVTQQITLLVQVLEGSENPLADPFVGKQKVEWAVLCKNRWKSLENDLLVNDIDNFSKSGILKFNIPRQATKDNTLLPQGHIWVRAKTHKAYDAVCKVIAIKAQAVIAEFVNNNNALTHLQNGLPAGNISKLITRVSEIKQVSQPFNSFGGEAAESDTAYYRRVSERLRHKNRAITLWDYEHLVLQKFPEVFKAKCLNHTTPNSFLSPGDVLLIVIPDIVDKNVFDIYEPRVSKATLNSIRDYINPLHSMHVNVRVINPEYQKVVVKLRVKFYDSYDEDFYKKQLDKDIAGFLSPWAFDRTEDITFGIELHSSILIDYIEKLYYVDYLEELEMAKHPEELDDPESPTEADYLNALTFVKTLLPESPKHILVSAKQHAIFTDIKTCSENSTEEAETCQY